MSAPVALTNLPVIAGHLYVLIVGGEDACPDSTDPPAMLDDQQVSQLLALLIKAMPRDSMILDLWDWDCQFEEDLASDWLFGAAFGPDAGVLECAEVLAEYFTSKAVEYDLDYGQESDPIAFDERVQVESERFIRAWRATLCARVFCLGTVV